MRIQFNSIHLQLNSIQFIPIQFIAIEFTPFSTRCPGNQSRENELSCPYKHPKRFRMYICVALIGSQAISVAQMSSPGDRIRQNVNTVKCQFIEYSSPQVKRPGSLLFSCRKSVGAVTGKSRQANGPNNLSGRIDRNRRNNAIRTPK